MTGPQEQDLLWQNNGISREFVIPDTSRVESTEDLAEDDGQDTPEQIPAVSHNGNSHDRLGARALRSLIPSTPAEAEDRFIRGYGPQHPSLSTSMLRDLPLNGRPVHLRD